MLINNDSKLKLVKTNNPEDYYKLIFSSLKYEKYKAGFMSKYEIIRIMISDIFNKKYQDSLVPCLNYSFRSSNVPLSDNEFLIYKVFKEELKKINSYFKITPNTNEDEMFLNISGVFSVPEITVTVEIEDILQMFNRDRDLEYILNPPTCVE